MGIRVLVVDDTRIIRNSVKDFFDRDFFDIVGEAADGADAVKAYKELQPDVVTMDMNMPRCDGVQAIKQILEMDPKAYIIIISSMDDDIMRGLEAGAKACVFKPISMMKFRELMEKVVNDLEKRKICITEIPDRVHMNSKYATGIKHGQLPMGWMESWIIQSDWEGDGITIRIAAEPGEKTFNKLVELLRFYKEKKIPVRILEESYLKENVKIQFLQMLSQETVLES